MQLVQQGENRFVFEGLRYAIDLPGEYNFELNAEGSGIRNANGSFTDTFRRTLIDNRRPGDANLDGFFNSTDFVNIFAAAQYEDGIPGNSTWETGDWNGDSEFTSSDFVVAFAGANQGVQRT